MFATLMCCQVVTMRSKASVKYSIPCLTDPVSKLEGLGTKTRKNLLNIRAGVRKIDARVGVPEDCPNEVKSGVDIVANHACEECL